MRDLPKCRLCLKHDADQKNSHIIPKFLCKSLFATTGHRFTIVIENAGNGRKTQDTPKEDNILCSACEKRIGVLETHFAMVFSQMFDHVSYPDQFCVEKLGTQLFIKCPEINPGLFKLFIYSLVWRSSISSLSAFRQYKLPDPDEEAIRNFLDRNLLDSKKLLIASSAAIKDVPSYHFCLIKPITTTEASRGIFTICNMNPTSHLMLLVDIALFFYTDENSIGDVLKLFTNKQNENVLITMADVKGWHELNEIVLRKALQKGEIG
jgi:hypothetical protein